MSRPAGPIYLDYHATTPVDLRVIEAMLPYFDVRFGNAASRSHSFGWQAEEAVKIARQQIANLLMVDSRDLVFTSGATEGLNFLIKGIADASEKKGRHIITIATEHHAVLDIMPWLEKKGFEVTMLPVKPDGTIDPDLLKSRIRKDTILLAAMWANNETGLIQDIPAIAKICRDAGVPLICDATQAVGKIEVHPLEAGIDMMVCSAHKFYGPKGIGVVYIDPKLKVKPTPLLHGGGHEHGYRSGTLNVPGIVGMGEASKFANADLGFSIERIKGLRDKFEQKVLTEVEEVRINGNVDHRLPTVTNLCVPFTDSQAVMTKFRSKLAISSGSACSSADPAPSHVLLAMGLNEAEAKASYRISFGRPTTEEEVETAAGLFIQAVKEYRSQNPVWQMHRQGMDVSGSRD
ncbi:MAG TPA: cysteine desulfurase family protein [Saprospiraceae bacterium]|nr:cysteine desulfurase family protein [Saprospiraceae bacterium]